MAKVPISPHQIPQHELQQQQQEGSQHQMLLAASQQQSQVQGQETPPSQQGGNNDLLDVLDQNDDDMTAFSESERSDGVSCEEIETSKTLFDALEKTQAGVVTLTELKRRSQCW